MMPRRDSPTEEDWPEFWWQRVVGPYEVVKKTVSSLQGKRSVVLKVPQDLPWRHKMRDMLREELQSTSGTESLAITFLDAEEDLPGEYEPGKYLVDKFGLRDDSLHYRSSRGSGQGYLLRRGVLRNKIVWIKGLGVDDAQVWERFCAGWNISTLDEGLFVIEDRTSETSVPQNLTIIDYAECVDEYSVQLFNGLTLNSQEFDSYKMVWKRYVAALMTSLCGSDVEVAHELVWSHDLRKEDAYVAITTMVDSGIFDSRGHGSFGHVLNVARRGDKATIDERIWAAQLEVLFPMIERERLLIVEKLSDSISPLIDGGRIEQHGDKLTSLEDVELGTLVYLMNCDQDGVRVLDVKEKGLRDRIFLLRKCRNHLAHHSCFCMDQFSQLLNS